MKAITFEELTEEVARTACMAEDEAIMGPEKSVKTRFLKLLEQHPQLTRPQAYMQAVMEIGELIIGAAVAPVAVSIGGDTATGPSVMRIIAAGEVSVITFPQDISREDFDRMTVEIRDAVAQAELRGEQKAIAFLMGEGTGEPVGTVKQSELLEVCPGTSRS